MDEAFAFLSVEEVVYLHAFVVGIHPDSAQRNVRDVGLLESALNRPRQLYFYEGAGLPSLAATLLWGIVQNHAFFDGNKRTAWLATQAFLYRNGYELPTDGNSTRLVLSIALGRRSVDQVESWIQRRLRVAEQMRMFEDY